MSLEQQEYTPAENEPAQQNNIGTPGQGQSKSSRRRRRKRNKLKTVSAVAAPSQTGGAGGADTAVNVVAQEGGPANDLPFDGGVVFIQAPSAPKQEFAGESGAKRWKAKKKKKFRAGGEGQGHRIEPGNSIHEPRSQRRYKQKGPRSFVGPMDHSYRAEIGNYADKPPSTIEVNGNRSNGQQRRYYNNGGGDTQASFNLISREAAPRVKQDAPTRIYCFVDDMFFLAKIQETARKVGVKVAFLKAETAETLLEMADDGSDQPALIIFDMNNLSAKPITLIPKLRTKFKRRVSLVGFLSHIQGDLKAKAVEAGCDTVMPRSAFSQALPNLLRRYGLDEEEEANFNA